MMFQLLLKHLGEEVTDLDLIGTAYDTRGTYPDQIDTETCPTLGVWSPKFVRSAEPGTTKIVSGDIARADLVTS